MWNRNARNPDSGDCPAQRFSINQSEDNTWPQFIASSAKSARRSAEPD